MADPIQEVDGYFVKGVDSYTSPDALLQSEVVNAMNVVFRGGLAQTRPGTNSLACLPIGNLQGMTFFVPENGVPHLVGAVDGYIYVSAPPFNQFRQLPNIKFSTTARNIAWAVCMKSHDYEPDGTLFQLDRPYSVLVMQDGLTRAAYWDGGISRHLNPMISGQTATLPLRDETKIGLWMAWSGNRLWVSRGNRVFASDIGDPLKFTETQYFAEGRSFYLDGPCTGMIETPDKQGLLVFTDSKGYLFQSSILDRTKWLSTDKFQDVVLPKVGCVAPRSIVNQYGYVWWFSPLGVTNFNASARANVTSRIDYQDNEMMASKWNLGSDMSGICSATHENYLLMSVPNGDVYNRHTWCLDQAVFEGNENAWNGYWTGWRPVEWASGVVDGAMRTFFASKDYDGFNRVWEAFVPDRKDNGCAISCFVQFREHTFGNLLHKRFHHAEILAREILGSVGVGAWISGQKGGWQRILAKEIVANEGQVYGQTEYSDTVLLAGNRPQTRSFKTAVQAESDNCNKCGVESDIPNITDRAFSMLVAWDGIMGVSKYGMTAIPESEAVYDGACETNEEAWRSLSERGCSAKEMFVTGNPIEAFTAGSTVTETTPDGITATASADGESVISQDAAQRRADCKAGVRARALLAAGIATVDVAWHYSTQNGESGLSTAQGNPNLSLGGFISQTEWLGGSLNDLYDNITDVVNESEPPDYRCIFVRHLDMLRTWRECRLYIGEQVAGGATVLVGKDPTGAVSSFLASFQSVTIASETIPPVGVTFLSPSSYADGIELGDIGPTECVAIWLKRTHDNDEVVAGDSVNLVVEGVLDEG